MNHFYRISNIQSTVGLVAAILFLIILAFGISWCVTCLLVYWISVLWAGTAFAFDWSWEFATGIWLILCLIGSFTSARVNLND